MPQRGRRNVDELLIMAFCCGATLKNAADSAGVSKSTAYRRSQEPEFQKKLRTAKTEMFTRLKDMLIATACEAPKTFLALMKESIPPSSRLGAARASIESAVSMWNAGESQERFVALERQLADLAAAIDTLSSLGPNSKDGRG